MSELNSSFVSMEKHRRESVLAQRQNAKGLDEVDEAGSMYEESMKVKCVLEDDKGLEGFDDQKD